MPDPDPNDDAKRYGALLICWLSIWILNSLTIYIARIFGAQGWVAPIIGKDGLAVISFMLDLLVVGGVIGCIGRALTGVASGIAINALNQYSLSRTQMALWTILVIATISCYARIRLLSYMGAVADPLAITIPGDLLAAMGISAFTTVAAPAILALKADQTTPPGDAAAAARKASAMAGGPATSFTCKGRVLVRTGAGTPTWGDMLTGDEVANAGTVDISKVQQLLITVVLIGAYAFLVMNSLATETCDHAVSTDCPLNTLPALSPSFIGLLALSHAGYLAYKAAPKPSPPPDAPAGAAADARAVGATGGVAPGPTGATGAP